MACKVKLECAFDDLDWVPTDFVEWDLDGTEFPENGPAKFELTLPVQQFDSVRFRVSVTPTEQPAPGLFTYKPNGITVYFTPAPEGPRLAARSKG